MKTQKRERGKVSHKVCNLLLKSVYQHHVDYMTAIGQKKYGSWITKWRKIDPNIGKNLGNDMATE